MKIILPDGFQIPENTREGDPFEAVALITPSEDGSFTLSSLDGVAIAEEEEAEEEESEEMEEPEAEVMAEPDIVLPFEQ
jgi:hypothetical protein